ncbi:MAG: TonB-dependent receptor [Kofleriaceae bacterium]
MNRVDQIAPRSRRAEARRVIGSLWVGFALAFALALVLGGSAAYADPATSGPETIIVIDKAPDPAAVRDRDRALGDAPFVTVIHPDDHPATASVADAVGQAVGAQTRSLGGLGAYESVTVRGAPPGHTAVLIDGVPVARIAAVTTDLGRFPLDSFGQVELYRGAVPIELGGAGVGGALNLVTRLGRGAHGERIEASAGLGSFGARHLRVHYGDAFGGLKTSTTLGYQGATGDFTYFNDNGTQLDTHDDSFKQRVNNRFDQVDLASRAGRGNDAAGLRLAYKDQGLPGSALQPSIDASLATFDAIADARAGVEVGPAVAKQLVYGLVERQHLSDPMGELGLGAQARDYLTLSGGASSTWIAPFDRHRASAGVELRADRFSDRDAGATRAALIGDRIGGAVLAALDLVVDPDGLIVVTPAVRLDLVRTEPTPLTTGPMALQPVPARDDVVPSPRLSARLAVSDDISIKASAGWYVRLPTLIELFGDRGTILGSPALLPERGPSADAGFVIAPSRAMRVPNGDLPDLVIDRLFLECAGFATRAHDTIALVPTSGFAFHAANIADALTYGLELVGSARIARTVSLTANYTHLVTAQLVPDPAFANKPLPRTPGDAIYARTDVVRGIVSAWFDASWQADTTVDQAALQRIPARLLLGTGVRVAIAAHFGVSLSIANLADVRVEQLPLVPPPRPGLDAVPTALADYAGFPLPGRSYYLALDWSHR